MRSNSPEVENTDKWITYARNWIEKNGPEDRETVVASIARKMPLHVASRRSSNLSSCKISLAKSAVSRLIRSGCVKQQDGKLYATKRKRREGNAMFGTVALVEKNLPFKRLADIAKKHKDMSLSESTVRTYVAVLSSSGCFVRKDGMVVGVTSTEDCYEAIRKRNASKLKSKKVGDDRDA